MNVLGLVFSILLILSYGFYACWDKQTASARLRNVYAAHQQVSRRILNSYESQAYAKLRGKCSVLKKDNPKVETEPEEESDVVAEEKTPELNRECARINLWPLIHEGKEKHDVLYELTAKLIRTFYGALDRGEKRFEYHFLDLLLASAKEAIQGEDPFSMEKIALLKPEQQRTYYKMLKGTKHWDLRNHIGYPPLLDYVKAVPSMDKICVFHAHPDLISVLFNAEIGWKLYGEIHQKNGPVLTEQLIEKVSAEMHQISIDRDLLKLLELGRPDHAERKKAFTAEDGKGDLSLRKNLSLDG